MSVSSPGLLARGFGMDVDAWTPRACPPRHIHAGNFTSEAFMQYQVQTQPLRTRDVVLSEILDARTHRNYAAETVDYEVYQNLVSFIDHLLGELYALDHRSQ
jgi:hypothetical protein